MIRILFFTDTHVRGTSPRARTDNYFEAITDKFLEVYRIAAKYRVNAIVHGGDLTDSPDLAYSVAGDLAALLLNNSPSDADYNLPLPIFIVPGNHDIYGYNADSLPRTPLGFLARLDIVHILDREPEIIFDGNNVVVSLTGQGFYHNIDRSPDDYQIERYYEPEFASKTVYHVHVVHGMLVERPLPYEVAHTLVKDCQTNADVILSGHEHLGYGLIKRSDGVWFCNPGALGRISAKIEEMYRQIKVALFEFTADGIRAELIPLESAKPGTEVLSRDHLSQLAEREDRMQRFLSLLAEEGESRLLEVREIVDDIARRESIPAAVRDEALSRLSAAREALTKAG